jgi:hypothetical protein
MAGQMIKTARLHRAGLAMYGVAAGLVVTLAGTALAVAPPGWWNNPNPGTAEIIYEKGSVAGAPTETEAVKRAFQAGADMLRQRITADTNLWPHIDLTETDIPFQHVAKDALGRWHAWLLVSYPPTGLMPCYGTFRRGPCNTTGPWRCGNRRIVRRP